MSNLEETRGQEEGDHPEIDRAFDERRGGQVPEEQAGESHAGPYAGPDPDEKDVGDGSDEDQGT